MSNIITEFRGAYRWLSNFQLVPHGVFGYPTIEHAYQAMKSKNPIYRDKLKQTAEHDAPTPGQAKRLGRTIQIRSDWDEIKYSVMEHCIARKFLYGSDLGQQLLDTGDAELVEGNTWHDNYWGSCRCNKCVSMQQADHPKGGTSNNPGMCDICQDSINDCTGGPRYKGIGLNHLGKLLMKHREKLQ